MNEKDELRLQRLIDNEMLDADADPDPGTEVRPQVYGG